MGIENLDELNREREKKIEEINQILKIIDKYPNYKKEVNNYVEILKGLSEKFKSENIVISVVAEVSSGKSTFLNALIFKDKVLDAKIGETTAKLFHIKYGNNYSINGKVVSNLEDIKKEIAEENKRNLNNIKSGNISMDETEIKLPDENLKKGIEIYDTPGFGTVNEETMYKFLKDAIPKSNGVIILLDISQGLKKNEKKFIKEFLDKIPENKRFIVLNKYDAIMTDDDLLFKSKEEINDEIQNVIKQVENELKELQNNKNETLETFYLSAQKALVAKKLNDSKKLEESRFSIFENKFWNRIVNAKTEIFDDNIKQLEENKKELKNILEDKGKNFYQQVENLKKLMNLSDNIKKELKNIINLKSDVKEIDDYINRETGNRINQNKQKLRNDIQESLKDNIWYYLKDVGGFLDSLAFWSLKEKYENAIKNGLESAENDLTNSLNEFIQNNLLFLKKQEQKVNNIINEISREFQKINRLDNSLKLKEIENINLGFEIKNGKVSINKNANIPYDTSDFFAKLGIDVSSGVVTTMIASRLITISLGPVGWIVGGILGMIIGNSKEKRNREILNKVVTEMIPVIENELSKEINSMTQFVYMASGQLTRKLMIIEENINNIKSSLQGKEGIKQQYQEIKEKFDEIKLFIKEIDATI